MRRIAVRARALGAIALALLLLAGCLGTTPRTRVPPSTQYPPAVPPSAVPGQAVPPSPAARIAPELVPDAVPRVEPRSPSGNPPFYEVFGKRYYVLPSSVGYVERGVASWYGPGFHEVRTSAGEAYDMYGMTAAHKTLPLPAYVRVINLQNGRSVVVRVNDRGPFVGNRIIDLSYTAAAKLDMLRGGTAIVEVRAIDPTAPEAAPGSSAPGAAMPGSAVLAAAAPPQAAAPAVNAPLYIQAGAFADPANAERLVAKLRGGGYGSVFVRENDLAGRKMYRVRIGPIADVPEFDRVVAALEHVGVNDARLALE
ncbi:MAG TPA: septal ring lytic transglycosylase RlpA family protein [Steroidobacteraceae bacterium]|nr:septal ring lytic transglycosylase RlpA family protein [Steroidobacteraceae bacterium]